MTTERFSFLSCDGKTEISAYRILPKSPRAMLQISHGMCEHFLRYEGFAEFLAERGILVFGHDHIGHGGSVSSKEALGFTASGGGSDFLVGDVCKLSCLMKKEYPALPLVLFGHSMGSFIVRAALEGADTSLYRAAIICGTGGPETPAGAGKLLAALLMRLYGEEHRSPLVKRIAFAGYNKRCGKGCDKNAWLTRDAAVVDRYNADPLCGFPFTLRAYHDLFTLVERVSRKDWAGKIAKDLPILVVGGAEDPVGNWGKGMEAVATRLTEAGNADVTLRLFPDMRHEILNEIDKEQVWSELYEWIQARLI